MQFVSYDLTIESILVCRPSRPIQELIIGGTTNSWLV